MVMRNYCNRTLSAGPGRGSVTFTPGGPGGSVLVPNISNLSDLNNFAVNWNQWEAITNSLYDSTTYAAAGQTSLQFFQTPQGQGTSWQGGGAKTLSDTNLTLASQIPNGEMFIVTSIELQLLPNKTLAAATEPYNTTPGALIVDDTYNFGIGGNLVFKVLNKNYLTEAPLGRFPPSADFTVSGAAFLAAQAIGYGNITGPVYTLTPNNILLIANQNFSVTLNWPEGVVALPSTVAARVFCRLNGIQFRLAQ